MAGLIVGCFSIHRNVNTGLGSISDSSDIIERSVCGSGGFYLNKYLPHLMLSRSFLLQLPVRGSGADQPPAQSDRALLPRLPLQSKHTDL
jgi:hypothetical protein